jgi:hypothetical protein
VTLDEPAELVDVEEGASCVLLLCEKLSLDHRGSLALALLAQGLDARGAGLVGVEVGRGKVAVAPAAPVCHGTSLASVDSCTRM